MTTWVVFFLVASVVWLVRLHRHRSEGKLAKAAILGAITTAICWTGWVVVKALLPVLIVGAVVLFLVLLLPKLAKS